jgi:hypothetical protein
MTAENKSPENVHAKTDMPMPADRIRRQLRRILDSSAFGATQALKELKVTVSDPVTFYDGTPIGAFLDSEGNKIWFCSVSGKSGTD